MNKAILATLNSDTQAAILRAILDKACKEAIKSTAEDLENRIWYALSFVQGYLAAHEWFMVDTDISDTTVARLTMLMQEKP